MHIKKLEICGFKSFVDRTVIHFDHDVIGVVGPNGCGKSNVVDAIRWVMGEQSAKALRGKGMGDVIFSGSESRPQGGFAEVTITFDNSDPNMARDLPLEYREYAELSVTRRIYRGDGSNEYFINKTPARLRDVTDVFLGTGVGRKAYSIVEQGKIGLIVSARPEDRRVLIEEAAGITKYKARKRQAETKMLLTRQNLTRVTDIVSEIERQLGNLKRQAAKAARYVRYREELDDLVLWDASHRWLELWATTGVAQAEASASEEGVNRERAEVDVRDAQIEVMRQEAKSAEQSAERAQSEAFLSDNEVREQHALIERSSDRYAHLTSRLRQAREEQVDLEQKARALATETEELSVQLTHVEAEQESESARVAAEAQRLDELKRESDGDDARLLRHRQDIASATASIARAEAELGGYERRTAETEARGARLSLELARLEGEHHGLGFKRGELDQRVRELTGRKQAMCDARDALGVELPQLRRELDGCEKALDKERATLRDKKSRLRALRELSERMEGVGAGVRNLLKTGDASLRGLIADRIEVPEEYTAALAGLIGERLQCVVVDDLDRALELLRGLAQGRRGRATVIPRLPEALPRPSGGAPLFPLNEQDSLPPPPPRAWEDLEGVIGLVADHIACVPEDVPLVRSLVGEAMLVKSAADALALQRLALGCEIVALDGTVFHADGRVTGGAGDSLASGLLESKREMRELEGVVAELDALVSAAEATVLATRGRVHKLQQALDQAKSEAHQAEIAMVTGQQDLKRLEQRLGIVGRRRDEVAHEVGELAEAIDKSQRAHAATVVVLEEAREVEAAARDAEEEAAAQAQTSRELHAAQQALVTERKVQLASVSERASACRDARERMLRDHRDISGRINVLENDRELSATEAGRVAADIFGAKIALAEARLRAREAQASFENARLGLDDARHALGLREAELREMRARLSELSARYTEQNLRLQRLLLEREHLESAIRERFRGLELAKIVGDHHAREQMTREHKGRISELTDTIDRMGAVNLDAMKEYEDESQRFDYYTEHKNDLEEALGDLEQAIAQMNRESERLFRHAFEGINRRFKEIFPKMFRGGKAELRLTNPEDMLETGIDILAQPPGKRLANIELMSGGEKAFTAVSLLLSIFRFKPSPFCILDEVDAPLDDANIDRYVEGIRAMTDRSQFIVITHSKRTMQAVDVLYGVTMQEPGVSKLVGVRVSESATRSAKRRSAPPVRPDIAPEQLEAAPTAVA